LLRFFGQSASPGTLILKLKFCSIFSYSRRHEKKMCTSAGSETARMDFYFKLVEHFLLLTIIMGLYMLVVYVFIYKESISLRVTIST
jgi:hypothetical protein